MTPKHLIIAQEVLGLGPAAMAHALGISSETFSEWQSGRQAVPTKVVRCVELLLLHPKTARRLAEKRSQIGRTGTVRRLLAATPARARDVDKLELSQPGIYAIFADKPATLGPQFGNVLQEKRTCLLYIGIASTSLRTRLVTQDFRGKGRSTFIQSLGAIWGYRPPAGSLGATSANYKFDALVTEEIIGRINRHLYVRWITDLRELSLEDAENYAIRQHKPILNIRRNPEPSPELKGLRAECRRIARSGRESGANVAVPSQR
jgi:hypothetical protein